MKKRRKAFSIEDGLGAYISDHHLSSNSHRLLPPWFSAGGRVEELVRSAEKISRFLIVSLFQRLLR